MLVVMTKETGYRRVQPKHLELIKAGRYAKYPEGDELMVQTSCAAAYNQQLDYLEASKNGTGVFDSAIPPKNEVGRIEKTGKAARFMKKDIRKQRAARKRADRFSENKGGRKCYHLLKFLKAILFES